MLEKGCFFEIETFERLNLPSSIMGPNITTLGQSVFKGFGTQDTAEGIKNFR